MTKVYNQNPEPPAQNKPQVAATLSSSSDAGGVAPLPCLYSNNSIEGELPDEQTRLETVIALADLLTPYRKRQAHTLFSNVHRLIEKEASSINQVGFLTLTFPENVTDPQEAYGRFRSMNTNFLSKWDEVKDWICVKERQGRGAWHYHLVAVFKGDILSGVNFEEIEAKNYKSAGQYLRDLWSELRAKLPEYGFGRSELLPVKSNAEAMGRYVGKYISKHMGQRTEEDKGVRLVNYSRGWVRNSIRFAWHSKNGSEWRRKLKKFADYIGCNEFYQISEKLGPGWAYRYAEEIRNIDFTMLEKGGEVSREYQDRSVPTIKRNKAVRIANEGRVTSFLSEENSVESIMTIEKIKREKARNQSVKDGKITSGMILNQKWFTTDENIEDVKEWARKEKEEIPLQEAFRRKRDLKNKIQAGWQPEKPKGEIPF